MFFVVIMVYADAVQDATNVTIAKEGTMPRAAKDAIIDLTDIVKEGHPEKPNLKSAKPSAAADDTLDDLDLEKEIDQIFADLSPPDKDEQGVSGRKDEPESDTLNLDDLFEEKEGNPLKVSNRADGTGGDDDSALDFADDFDRLFAEEAQSQPKSPPKSAVINKGATQSSDEPDWLAELDGLGLDEARPEARASESEPLEINSETEIESLFETTKELEAEFGLEDVLDVPQAMAEETTEGTTADASTSVGEAGAAEATPDGATSPVAQEISDFDLAEQRRPASDQQSAAEPPESPELSALSAHHDTDDEVPTQAALSESVLRRLHELEDRLAALENQEPPRIDVPEPDLEGLLAQVDERIAASPALADLDRTQAEAMQTLESRLSAIARQEPPQPDTEGLQALMDQRIAEQVGARLDSMMQTVDDMAGQAEVAATKVVDAESAKLSESILSEVDQRLKERLEESFTERLEIGLDQLKASIQEVMEQKLSSAMDEIKQGNGEQPEDPRIAELASGLDALTERIEELARDRSAQSGASEFQEQAEQLGTRLLETVRQEMQEMRTDWDGQKSTLAKDLENSLNYWAKLQDKFKALQGEWQVLRQEREAGASALPDGWRDELGALLDERLEHLRTELLEDLREDLKGEVEKAVPLAAARIIREEIQALTQEEGEDEQ